MLSRICCLSLESGLSCASCMHSVSNVSGVFGVSGMSDLLVFWVCLICLVFLVCLVCLLCLVCLAYMECLLCLVCLAMMDSAHFMQAKNISHTYEPDTDNIPGLRRWVEIMGGTRPCGANSTLNLNFCCCQIIA